MVHEGVRVPASRRRLRAVQQHHAAEAQSGGARARAGARQQGAGPGGCDPADGPQHAVRRHRRHRGRPAAARVLDVRRREPRGAPRRRRDGVGGVRSGAPGRAGGGGLDHRDGAGRHARTRSRCAVQGQPPGRGAFCRRVRSPARGSALQRVARGLRRRAGPSHRVRRPVARRAPERPAFRERPHDARRSRAGGNGARDRGLP